MSDLSPMVEGYLEALFWIECNEIYTFKNWNTKKAQKDIAEGYVSGSIPRDADYTCLTPAAIFEINAECLRFKMTAGLLYDEAVNRPNYSEERMGHDFWLTRNGHGAGFWDREELSEGGLGDKLSNIARRFGEVTTYVTDGGEVDIA